MKNLEENYLSIEEAYIKEIKYIPLLTAEEELELAKKIHISDKYREAFIKANLRLVSYIARRYKGLGMDFLDLVEEGNIGLIKAVDKFDWTKGYKFSSYAELWIRQSIKRAIYEKGKAIRLPESKINEMYEYNKVINNLITIYGDDLSAEVIAKEMGITVDRVGEIKYLINVINVASLDTPINSDGYGIETLIPSDKNPFAEIENKMLSEDIIKAMEILTEKEKKVLLHRYGFYDNKPKTLIKTAKAMGCKSFESTRVTQQRALDKLKRSHYLKNLL